MSYHFSDLSQQHMPSQNIFKGAFKKLSLPQGAGRMIPRAPLTNQWNGYQGMQYHPGKPN